MNAIQIFMAVLAMMLLGSSSIFAASPDTYLANEGVIELSKGHYSRAEAYFLASLEERSNNPYAILHLGIVYELTRRPKKAVELYQMVIKWGNETKVTESIEPNFSDRSLVAMAENNLKALEKKSVHQPMASSVNSKKGDPAMASVTVSPWRSNELPYQYPFAGSAAVYASIMQFDNAGFFGTVSQEEDDESDSGLPVEMASNEAPAQSPDSSSPKDSAPPGGDSGGGGMPDGDNSGGDDAPVTDNPVDDPSVDDSKDKKSEDDDDDDDDDEDDDDEDDDDERDRGRGRGIGRWRR